MRGFDKVTADIASVAHDLHMKVKFSPSLLRPGREPDPAPSAPPNRNYGIDSVAHLSLGVGYPRISEFAQPSLVAPKYASVMNTTCATTAADPPNQ